MSASTASTRPFQSKASTHSVFVHDPDGVESQPLALNILERDGAQRAASAATGRQQEPKAIEVASIFGRYSIRAYVGAGGVSPYEPSKDLHRQLETLTDPERRKAAMLVDELRYFVNEFQYPPSAFIIDFSGHPAQHLRWSNGTPKPELAWFWTRWNALSEEICKAGPTASGAIPLIRQVMNDPDMGTTIQGIKMMASVGGFASNENRELFFKVTKEFAGPLEFHTALKDCPPGFAGSNAFVRYFSEHMDFHAPKRDLYGFLLNNGTPEALAIVKRDLVSGVGGLVSDRLFAIHRLNELELGRHPERAREYHEMYQRMGSYGWSKLPNQLPPSHLPEVLDADLPDPKFRLGQRIIDAAAKIGDRTLINELLEDYSLLAPYARKYAPTLIDQKWMEKT